MVAKDFNNFCLFLAQHFFPASEVLKKLTLLVESEDLNHPLLYHPNGSSSEHVLPTRKDGLYHV